MCASNSLALAADDVLTAITSDLIALEAKAAHFENMVARKHHENAALLSLVKHGTYNTYIIMTPILSC